MAGGYKFAPLNVRAVYQNDGSAKSSFLAEVAKMTNDAGKLFKDFSNEARTQLDAALSVKRNSAGSLDLGVDELRAAAAAQNARAIAAREVAAATALAAKEEGDYSQKTRLAVAATQALAIEEERAAAQARAHAQAAEQVQERLNRQASATDAVVAATRRGTSEMGNVINGIRAQRVAFTQLGQQLQDVVVQTQAGTNATTIFVQQVPQMAFALSGLTESTNKFQARIGKAAQFLAGPWGAAIFAATAVLAPFISELLNSGNALDELVAKLKKDAEETEKARLAKELFKKTEEGVRKAILDQREALDQQEKSLVSSAQRARDDAKANLDREIQIRRTTEALLQQALAEQEIQRIRAQAPGQRGENATFGFENSTRQASALEERLRKATEAVKVAQGNFGRAQSFFDVERGRRAADPVQVIEDRYKRLIEQARRRAVAEGKVGESLERQVKALERQKKAALDALTPSRASSSGMSGREISSSEASSIARKAGFQVNSADRSFSKQKALYDQWVAAGRPSDNPVAKPGTSAHERGNALDIQFGQGVTPASIRKAFADEGVRLTKVFKERGHFHVEWSTSGADKVLREIEQIDNFGKSAAETIARINERFNEQPRLVDQAAAATRELDRTIAELNEQQPAGFKQMIADAEAAKGVIQDALLRPLRDITKETQQQIQYQMLLLQGRDGEAQALQQITQLERSRITLTEAQKKEVTATAVAYQRISEEMQRAAEVQSSYLDATRSIRQEVEGVLGGYGSLASLGSVIKRQFQNVQGKVLTEQLFGDMFRDLDRWVKKETGIKDSVDILTSETERAGSAAGLMADALADATRRISGIGTPSAGLVSGPNATTSWGWPASLSIPASIRNPAYDGDPNPITVAGAKANKPVKTTVNDLTPADFFMRMGNSIGSKLIAALEGALGGRTFLSKFTNTIGGAIGGYAALGTKFGAGLGAARGLAFDYGKDLFGEKLGDKILGKFDKALGGAQTGSMISDISNALGLKMSKTGSQIGGAIGSFIPIPGGQIIGSIAGGLLGNLFGKKVNSGYAQVRNGSVVGTYGRTKDLQNDASEAAGGLVDTIASLAKTLGTRLGNYDFDFGKRNDRYVVNTGARGVFTFENEQQAAEFAVREAVADGAFLGMKDAQKRLIMANGNLQSQVEKAVKFGDVFKQLKAIKDPVGAALDDLNSQFSDLIDIFKEAGASAEELGSLEELYGLKRKDAVKQAQEATLGPLKSLQQSLKIGSDFYSLRDRQASAQAIYNPLKARVAAGDTSAFSEFSDAAQSLLDIQRQIFGSTSPFFDLLKEVTDLSNGALTSEQAKIDAANVSDSPFKDLATQQQATTSAIDAQTAAIVAALGGINENLVAALQIKVANNNSGVDVTSLLSSRGAW